MQKKILDNLWLKFGAILLACLLWLYASTDKSYEYTFSYKVELVNLSQELILAEPLPTEAKVRISGKGKELLKLLLLEKRSLKIDAHKYSKGKFTLPLKPEMIEIPERLDLSVTEIISPKVLRIDLQQLEERKVPLVSQLTFFPAEGYFIKGETRFIPDRIRVRGPSEGVQKTKFLLTQKKEFQNMSRSLSETIDLIPPAFYNLKIFPQKVDFSIEIKKGEKTRLEKLSVKIINLPKGKKGVLIPQTIDLEILGEKETLEKFAPESIEVIVDVKGLKNGKVKVSPSIKLPEDIILLKAEPDSFNLEIK
jgi:YbbR domain-containing protein